MTVVVVGGVAGGASSDEWLGRTVRRAVLDAEEWVEANRAGDEPR